MRATAFSEGTITSDLTLSVGIGADSQKKCDSAPRGAEKIPCDSRLPPIPSGIGPDPRNANACLHLESEPRLEAGGGVLYDFNFGFRIKMPNEGKVYRLRVFDGDTQTLEADMLVPGGALAVGDRKYFIRYHFEVTDTETGCVIAVHDYDCSGKRVMVIVPDGALGDNFAWMPYAEEFRKKHHAEVTCVCGDWLTRIIREEYPELEFASVADIPSSGGYYASYFCAIFPPERKGWRPCDHQNFGMQGSVAKILGLDCVPRRVRLPRYARGTVSEPYVCISVLATSPAKYWNYPDGWNILCRYLKRIGYRVFVIDRDHDLTFKGKQYSVPEEAEDCTGLIPIRERIAMLQHAEFFVGLPSGLSWVAWSCGIPVVLISGFTLEGSEFPTPYRVFNQNFCHGCWNDSNLFFDARASIWCPRHSGTEREIECTRVITPKMVIDTVNRIPSVSARLEARAGQIEISVVIPVTGGQTITACVRSVVAAFAAYGRAEILLCNDASAEPDFDLRLQMLCAENPDMVRHFRGAVRLGAAGARAELVRQARGRYIMCFDDGKIMGRFDVAGVVGYLDAHPQIQASYAPGYSIGGARNGGLIAGVDLSRAAAFADPNLAADAVIVRKSAIETMPIGKQQVPAGEAVLTHGS